MTVEQVQIERRNSHSSSQNEKIKFGNHFTCNNAREIFHRSNTVITVMAHLNAASQMQLSFTAGDLTKLDYRLRLS